MRSTSARVAVAVLYAASGWRVWATAYPPAADHHDQQHRRPSHLSRFTSPAPARLRSSPGAHGPGPNLATHSPLTGWLTAIDVAVIAPVESALPTLATQRPTLTSSAVAFADLVHAVSADVVTRHACWSPTEPGRTDSTVKPFPSTAVTLPTRAEAATTDRTVTRSFGPPLAFGAFRWSDLIALRTVAGPAHAVGAGAVDWVC